MVESSLKKTLDLLKNFKKNKFFYKFWNKVVTINVQNIFKTLFLKHLNNVDKTLEAISGSKLLKFKILDF